MNTFKFFKKKYFYFLIALSCLAGIIGLYYHAQSTLTIRDFNKTRDAVFIQNIFNKDWYWLVAEGSDFSPEYMMEHRVSSKDPFLARDLSIKVLFDGDIPTGFIAYYKKNFYTGNILFLAIDQTFRKKGYSKILLNHALDDLKKQGIFLVKLVTRTTNTPALTTYKRIGFKESYRDNGFVFLEKEI